MTSMKYAKRLLYLGIAGAGGFYATTILYPSLATKRKSHADPKNFTQEELQLMNAPLPLREELINNAKSQELDILVIGGGATGLGVALDSVTRGLKTGLVEKFDFASGTSSRSTKLIHGGVRYLQKAVFNLDIEQYRMVKEALYERANLINIAPHLAYPLPIMLPVYKWWQVPYFWAGIKMYDLVAGSQLLKPSYLLSKSKALELFPMLKRDKLKAALVYYDGQHDDSRMAVSLALTAIRHGAHCLNYTKCVELLKTSVNGEEKVVGARVQNTLTGEEYNIRAKCVINATGPYTDQIRTMGDKEVPQICQPSSGVHVVLPEYYSPASMGLLDPDTSDGRVIFFLPWQNVTLAGTTDTPCEVADNPKPTETEIQFILKEIKNYLSQDVEVRRGDVLSAWSGIRPLVSDPNKKDTQSIARNHIIEVAPNKLITIAGGKWTTYRSMAEETVDRAIVECELNPSKPCATKGLMLDGSHGWSPTLFIRLVQDFGLENAVAQHLAGTYGDKAFKVAKLSNMTGKRWPVVGKRLHEEYPYIEGEVKYAIREYACRAIDVLARRTRLSFINVHAAQEAMPRVVEIMAQELKWSEARKKEELAEGLAFIQQQMGGKLTGTPPLPEMKYDGPLNDMIQHAREVAHKPSIAARMEKLLEQDVQWIFKVPVTKQDQSILFHDEDKTEPTKEEVKIEKDILEKKSLNRKRKQSPLPTPIEEDASLILSQTKRHQTKGTSLQSEVLPGEKGPLVAKAIVVPPTKKDNSVPAGVDNLGTNHSVNPDSPPKPETAPSDSNVESQLLADQQSVEDQLLVADQPSVAGPQSVAGQQSFAGPQSVAEKDHKSPPHFHLYATGKPDGSSPKRKPSPSMQQVRPKSPSSSKEKRVYPDAKRSPLTISGKRSLSPPKKIGPALKGSPSPKPPGHAYRQLSDVLTSPAKINSSLKPKRVQSLKGKQSSDTSPKKTRILVDIIVPPQRKQTPRKTRSLSKTSAVTNHDIQNKNSVPHNHLNVTSNNSGKSVSPSKTEPLSGKESSSFKPQLDHVQGKPDAILSNPPRKDPSPKDVNSKPAEPAQDHVHEKPGANLLISPRKDPSPKDVNSKPEEAAMRSSQTTSSAQNMTFQSVRPAPEELCCLVDQNPIQEDAENGMKVEDLVLPQGNNPHCAHTNSAPPTEGKSECVPNVSQPSMNHSKPHSANTTNPAVLEEGKSQCTQEEEKIQCASSESHPASSESHPASSESHPASSESHPPMAASNELVSLSSHIVHTTISAVPEEKIQYVTNVLHPPMVEFKPHSVHKNSAAPDEDKNQCAPSKLHPPTATSNNLIHSEPHTVLTTPLTAPVIEKGQCATNEQHPAIIHTEPHSDHTNSLASNKTKSQCAPSKLHPTTATCSELVHSKPQSVLTTNSGTPEEGKGQCATNEQHPSTATNNDLVHSNPHTVQTFTAPEEDKTQCVPSKPHPPTTTSSDLVHSKPHCSPPPPPPPPSETVHLKEVSSH